MKIFATAMALVLAYPAAAQTAPAQPEHQGHQQMQGHAEHGQHQAGHGDHQGAQHQGHAMREGCCEDRNGDGRMDCCEHMAQATEQHDCCAEHADQPSAQHQGH